MAISEGANKLQTNNVQRRNNSTKLQKTASVPATKSTMNSTRVSWLVVACCAEGWRRSCTSSHALQHCNAPWHQPLATSNSTDDANRSLRLTQHTTHTTRCSSMQHWHKTHHIHHARQRHAKTHGGVDPVAQGHVMQLAMQRECGHSRMHACTHARMHACIHR